MSQCHDWANTEEDKDLKVLKYLKVTALKFVYYIFQKVIALWFEIVNRKFNLKSNIYFISIGLWIEQKLKTKEKLKIKKQKQNILMKNMKLLRLRLHKFQSVWEY